MIPEKYLMLLKTSGSVFLGRVSCPGGCNIVHQAKPVASALSFISSHRRVNVLSSESKDHSDLKRSLYLFRKDGEEIAVIAGCVTGITFSLSLMSGFRLFP